MGLAKKMGNGHGKIGEKVEKEDSGELRDLWPLEVANGRLGKASENGKYEGFERI